MRRYRLVAVLLVVIIVVLGIALTFSLISGSVGAGRPQIGKVEFQNGDVKLAGNLWVPASEGPFPAVVLVHDSAKITSQDYKYLGFFFLQNGFATLLYDKRGVGESGGSYERVLAKNSEAVFDDLAGDVLAAIELLVNHDRVDPDRIGLFGLSQAGWIAPLAASRSSDIAFIALYSGPVCTVGEEWFYSGTTGAGPGNKLEGITLKEASDMARDQESPDGFDPLPSLATIDIPGLWMFGDQDRSTPTVLSVENLDALVAEYGKDFSYIVYPNADHNLMDADTDQFFPAMSDAVDWIVEKVGD